MKKTMLGEKQRHSAALKSVTVNLAPANYKQAILSRWELASVGKKSLLLCSMTILARRQPGLVYTDSSRAVNH